MSGRRAPSGTPAERLAKSPGARGEPVGATAVGGAAEVCGAIGHRRAPRHRTRKGREAQAVPPYTRMTVATAQPTREELVRREAALARVRKFGDPVLRSRTRPVTAVDAAITAQIRPWRRSWTTRARPGWPPRRSASST